MTKKSDAGERMCSAESASDTEKMCNAETTCNTEKICNAEKMRNTEKICNVETTCTPETTCDTEKQRDMAWKLLNRDIVFQDTWVQLEASRCELPDGRIIAPFYIRRDPDFAVVVAVTKDKRLVLVRQYRLGAEKVLLELPAGCIEKGEDPKVAAGRELLEETGVACGCLEQLRTFSTPGRDPRRWVITCAYLALVEQSQVCVKAGDDAKAAEWFRVRLMDGGNMQSNPDHLAMHGQAHLWNLELQGENETIEIPFLEKQIPVRFTPELSLKESENGLAFDHALILAYAVMKGKRDFSFVL